MPYHDDEELAYMDLYGDDDDDDDYGDDDDDDYGDDDEYGMTDRKASHLLRKRAKLAARIPTVGPARQRRLAKRLARIDRRLGRGGYTAQNQAAADITAASGVNGIGGLQFQAQAPPGIGRLVRLPFYPTQANANTITAAGIGAASFTNPVFIDTIGFLGGLTAGAHKMLTPQISWATLRIVGFESQQRKFAGINESGPVLLVQNLKIGGGANLFTHEDWADATIYDADQPEFVGLRDYPVLRSPNQSEVLVQVVSPTVLDAITASVALLAEVLVDDNYGAHVPGPYSRAGALVRQGGSFVS